MMSTEFAGMALAGLIILIGGILLLSGLLFAPKRVRVPIQIGDQAPRIVRGVARLGRELSILFPEAPKSVTQTDGWLNTIRSARRVEREELIRRSGNPWGVDAQTLGLVQVVSAGVGLLAGTGFGVGIQSSAGAILFAILFGVFGFRWPLNHYRHAHLLRTLEFNRVLPGMLHTIRLIHANQAFISSVTDTVILERSVGRDNTVVDSLEQISRAVDAGTSQEQAIRDWGTNAPTESLQMFAYELADNLNNATIVSTILTREAETLNKERIETIRTYGTKRGLELTVVTLLFFLPVFFAIILSPALVRLSELLGSM